MEMGSTEHKADCNLLIKLDRHDKERGPFGKEMIALDTIKIIRMFKIVFFLDSIF